MAAEEEEGQGVVLVRELLVLGGRCEELVGRYQSRGRVLAAAASLVAAQLIGQPPGRDRDQPAPRALRYAFLRPLHRGGQQRLLHRVLAEVESSIAADDCSEDSRRQLPKQV